MAIWTPETSTLNAMLKNGFELQAVCFRCKKVFPIDVGWMARQFGPGFSLWDKRWSCRRGNAECDGKCVFQCRNKGSATFRAMITWG